MLTLRGRAVSLRRVRALAGVRCGCVWQMPWRLAPHSVSTRRCEVRRHQLMRDTCHSKTLYEHLSRQSTERASLKRKKKKKRTNKSFSSENAFRNLQPTLYCPVFSKCALQSTKSCLKSHEAICKSLEIVFQET